MRARLPHWLLGLALIGWFFTARLYAGGSGLNTVVVINQASSNSIALGNYYCQQRRVPSQNVLYVDWTGSTTIWASNDFQTDLVTPLLNMLAARQLTNQIYYVVLSMDIPFETVATPSWGTNATTAALFYGLRLGNGSDPFGLSNSYAATESVLGQTIPVGAAGYSFLTTMITSDSLAYAEQMVNQGVSSDGTFPQQPVVLAKSSDGYRNIRYVFFDNAIFNVNILGVSTILSTNTDAVWWTNGCLGYQTGLANFSVPQGMFVPGAIADSMTSFGGEILDTNNSQTSLLAFIDAGATGSYGTVIEPANDTQKFPNPQVYFYQARGFTLAESYYQSVNSPYLGLTVGDPLAAPFAHPGNGKWTTTNIANAVLSGTTNLSIKFNAYDANHPLRQVDLFVDGSYYATLTNLPPTPGNKLTVTLNGYPITYTVPTNSTLGSVAAGLAASISAASNFTLVKPIVHGDRIELQCIASNPAAVPFFVGAGNPSVNSNSSYNASYLPASFPPPMIPGRPTKQGAFTMEVGIPSALSYVIQASTNLTDWQAIMTNNVPGWLNFTDFDSTNYPKRFYRISWPLPSQPPQLSLPTIISGGGFRMHVNGVSGQPWAVEASSDLINWTSVFTNEAGGAMDFIDTGATNSTHRFYRAWLVSPPLPSLAVVNPATNVSLIQVGNAVLPYTVSVSTNQGQWTTLGTNFAIGVIQTSTTNAAGTGGNLSTFVRCAQPTFQTSQAYGLQGYTVISNLPPTNAWIYCSISKTNGQVVAVGVTNQSGVDSTVFATQLYNAINANTNLQGSDGVMAADYVSSSGAVTFNIYARSPGYAASAIQIQPRDGKVIMTTPQGALRQNLSDLEPRNHLYVSAGASSLGLTFPLDTTTLTDGSHELTAVAYEGTDVRTQTQTTVPVQIQNGALNATIHLLDLSDPAPAQGTYHIEVGANADNVSEITLFSTGGAVGTATNSSKAIFQVSGTKLGVGSHKLYAVVKTSDGHAYRTKPEQVRLIATP